MLTIILIVLILFLPQSRFSQQKQKGGGMEIKIESGAFNDGGFIPSKYTCDGNNVSPDLKWSGVPSGVKSFAIINDDPDAPSGDWVHWVLYNIPGDVTEIKENIPPEKIFPNGMIHGINDFRKYGYGGPCPPSGIHRYYFKLYALDILLKPLPGMTKNNLLAAMQKHIIAEGHLMGKYKKKQ